MKPGRNSPLATPDIRAVVLTARIGAVIAAITWLVGAPLFSLAGVPFPSDAQFLVLAAIAALLGLTLLPVALALSGTVRSRRRAVVRFSGLAICLALIASGTLLALGASGRLGERAPDWVTDPTFVSLPGLFLWISLASWATRGPSTIERGAFWLGLLTAASCLVPFLASVLMFFFLRDFVWTDATILPVLLVDVILWLSLPVWLVVVVIRLSERLPARKAQPAGQ